MKMEGLITDQEFLIQRTSLTRRQFAIEENLGTASLKLSTIRQDIEEVKKPLVELGETWHALSPPLQIRFKRMLLPVGFVVGQIRTAECALIFRAFGNLANAKTNGVHPTGEILNRIIQEIQAFAVLFRSIAEEKRTT
jgi:hypothetical protein